MLQVGHYKKKKKREKKGVLVCFRFGVIHSVFTNLLLWANSVLNESKHQLNEHKERLTTLGFGNITTGEWPGLPGCRVGAARTPAEARMFRWRTAGSTLLPIGQTVLCC